MGYEHGHGYDDCFSSAGVLSTFGLDRKATVSAATGSLTRTRCSNVITRATVDPVITKTSDSNSIDPKNW